MLPGSWCACFFSFERPFSIPIISQSRAKAAPLLPQAPTFSLYRAFPPTASPLLFRATEKFTKRRTLCDGVSYPHVSGCSCLCWGSSCCAVLAAPRAPAVAVVCLSDFSLFLYRLQSSERSPLRSIVGIGYSSGTRSLFQGI